MALRNLKDYYRAAQFRPVIKWFDEGWLHCKVDIERALARHSKSMLTVKQEERLMKLRGDGKM